MESRSSPEIPAFLPFSFLNLLFIFLWVSPSETKAEITVASAISMGDALEEISEIYSSTSGQKIRHTFAGTNVLARQIESGAPIDIFISADMATMDALRKKKLVVESTVRMIASNELVVVMPVDVKLIVNAPSDFLSVKRVSIADPASVPAGIYAKKWLETERIWDEMKPKTIPLQNVRAALLAVETGNADAAIVYRTDALSSEKVLTVFTIPKEKSGAIEYPAAVVADSGHLEKAERFLKFLTSIEAVAIFTKHGFGKP